MHLILHETLHDMQMDAAWHIHSFHLEQQAVTHDEMPYAAAFSFIQHVLVLIWPAGWVLLGDKNDWYASSHAR
jgi:hypothetical protein